MGIYIKLRKALLIIGLPFLALSACKDEEEPYPNLISEMADLYTDDRGTFEKIVLDDMKEYTITNPSSGYSPKVIYRTLCGFVPNGNKATIYQLEGAYILRDSTKNAKLDPVNPISVWRTKSYINLHLAAKTQGGQQYWGFITDSIVTSEKDGQTSSHAYLSLHHDQHADPTSYTQDIYASLPIDSIKGISRTDAITLRVNTFNGKTEYELK